MESVVEGLAPGTLGAAARHYARQSPPTGPADVGAVRDEVVARGEEIARFGIPGAKVPGCVPCHGPGGEDSHNEHYPLLAGQHPDYLANQLALFRADRRGESLYAHVMELNADGLSSEDIVAVSAYYASLRPGQASTIDR
jgi:cytochrome c553